MFEIRTFICQKYLILRTLYFKFRKMKKSLLLFCIVYFILNTTNAHPFYVSVTQIDYKEESLQITLKIFVEDLEKTLIDEGKPKLYIGEKNENTNSTQIIQNYLSDKFSISINDGNLEPYIFIGKEVEDDAVWIYLEVKRKVKNVKSLDIKNTIITEKHESQTNLIHTNISGQKKSLILNKMKPRDKLTY